MTLIAGALPRLPRISMPKFPSLLPKVKAGFHKVAGLIPKLSAAPAGAMKLTDDARAPGMELSDAGLDHIKQWESLRTVAYQDTGGVWTIGYGHTRTARKGMTITEAKAEKLLERDVAWAEAAVSRYVKVPLRQCQFDALVSFCFNVGATAFRKSTLVKELNKGNYDAVPTQLMRWKHDNGKVIQGLINRRVSEVALWNEAEVKVAAPQPKSESEPVERPGKVGSKPHNGPIKTVKDSWTIRGALAVIAAVVLDIYNWIVGGFDDVVAAMGDLRENVGPIDGLMTLAADNVQVIVWALIITGSLVAISRRLHAGWVQKEG
ncbi:MAG: lysozyme [bacterium]